MAGSEEGSSIVNMEDVEDPKEPVSPLQALQAMQAEFDSFSHRLRQQMTRLEEDLRKQQAEGFSRSLDNSFGGLNSRGLGQFKEDQAPVWAQEPPALVEHRLRREEKTIRKRRHMPIGPIASMNSSGSDWRLHNRWLQLSMQCDTVAAISDYRSSRLSASPGQALRARNATELPFVVLGKTLHPGSLPHVCWDFVAVTFLLLDSILLPLNLAWEWPKETSTPIGIALLVHFLMSIVFWTLDIIMNFNTGFYQKGALISSKYEIAKHYIRTWCVFDCLLVSLDYITVVNIFMQDLLTDLTFVRFARIVRLTRLLRLVKMAKIDGFIQEMAASTGRQWIMLAVTIQNSTIAIVILLHTLSCVWVSIAGQTNGSWIELAGIGPTDAVMQYLHAFRYVMMPITPPELKQDSLSERVFDILLSVFWMAVLGFFVSKISSTMAELRAMNESKSKHRREIRRYLRSQEASFELVSRVMKFVEYKLDKLTPINFDGSLISNTLQTELCVNQRSRFLERLPICKVTKDLFPEAFANLCTNLKKIVCENGEDVYVAGGHSSCMYITITGEYVHVENYQDQEITEELFGVHCLEEISLYVDNWPHQASLAAKTFAEMYILEGDDLVKSLQHSPGSAAMFFEYARELTSSVGRLNGRVDRLTQVAVAERCCKMTRIYQEVFPDQKFRLDTIPSSEFSIASDSPCETEPERRGIGWLLKEGWLEDLEEATLPHQLRSSMAELHPETGSHIIFEQPQERDRAESSCISILALVSNRYDIFTRPQDASIRLRRQQWEQLQAVINWVRPSIEEIQTVLVLLAIRPLGKSKFVICQVPNHDRRPESAVLYLLDYCHNVVPSVKELSEQGLSLARATLQVHEAFNFAQMLQGENVPANVAQLQEKVKREGEHSLRFYILFLLGFMSGLEAGSGSRFLNAKRAENVIEAIGMLQHLLSATPRGIYWGYLCQRARALQLPAQTSEDLVFIRLACLMRIQGESTYGKLKASWNRLGAFEKATLINHFLADGIEEVAFVFEFLPDCVANAMKNPVVTLTGLLEMLEELLHTLKPTVDLMPDLKEAKVIQVDLSDMSEFIACVQNTFVFETCVSRCKIRFSGRRAQLEMTGNNWSRIREADSDLTSLAYCMRDVMQRQQAVEHHLNRLDRYRTPRASTFSI
ncbi:unnamed protein product [Effrenium voratum]|uniref:Cyclic nucleotide-binding domain-containing protein n=1 Tax=Effrenium voratum TaxID=2562239 RepID=A0AA36N1R1_9DINO|nr:unnamed protein product [Effrenium voratum]CAJ1395225.1 unnamed protein product [Effrenium voratum]CAJ1430569.1 unnamed protein product [Effrenium voratum]